MWSLLLSALTIGFSLVTKKESVTTGQIRPNSRLLVKLSQEDRLFYTGAVLGIGCTLLYNVVMNYFRVFERMRFTWHSIWKEEGSDVNWYESAPINAIRKFLVKNEKGSIGLIVTPETAKTSSLNVSVITLKPGHEIPPTESVGVEFYYVVSGAGNFSQFGVNQTPDIKAGDCFIIHPRCTRWITNSKQKTNDNLVLLRATDGGVAYSRSSFPLDVIKVDASYHHRLQSLDVFREGMRTNTKSGHRLS